MTSYKTLEGSVYWLQSSRHRKRSTELDTELMLLHLPQLTSSLGSLQVVQGFKNCGAGFENKVW